MKVIEGSRPPWFPLPRAWRSHAIQTPGSMLLETAGGMGDDHFSYLFTQPEKIFRATSASELLMLLDDIGAAAQDGLYAAGRIDYEAAYALHNIPSVEPSQPIACFVFYRDPLRFDHHSGIASGPVFPSTGNATAISAFPTLSPPNMGIDREIYAKKFEAIQQLLAAGDTYQVNFTTHVDAELFGSPLALYETLIDAQPVDFAAILNFDSLTLSFSPELFFRTEKVDTCTRLITRPMKGTAPRGKTAEEDAQQLEWLSHDEKNHAEHVMIVDLLRNDIGRICEPGSVRTDHLFRVEQYPTLFQMTSTVSGTLHPAARFADIIAALFPSGSVTGAPKRRTMEIIRDLEDQPRGIYTGAIGFISPSGEACFSVPIRTLDIRNDRATMGVGGGIVADSTAAAEYDECLLKASFLNHASTPPQLIETMLWSDGYPMLDLHMARLLDSAAYFSFQRNPPAIRAILIAAASDFREDRRVRLVLTPYGDVEIESSPLTGPTSDLRVRLAAHRTLSSDLWHQHKTTRRAFYDREFARARKDGFDEVLFLNERGELAEGAISTIFVELDGRLYTPPLTSGALPGILRRHLLQTHHGNIAEKILYMEDLVSATTVYVGNALRGLRSIASLHIE